VPEGARYKGKPRRSNPSTANALTAFEIQTTTGGPDKRMVRQAAGGEKVGNMQKAPKRKAERQRHADSAQRKARRESAEEFYLRARSVSKNIPAMAARFARQC